MCSGQVSDAVLHVGTAFPQLVPLLISCTQADPAQRWTSAEALTAAQALAASPRPLAAAGAGAGAGSGTVSTTTGAITLSMGAVIAVAKATKLSSSMLEALEDTLSANPAADFVTLTGVLRRMGVDPEIRAEFIDRLVRM